MYLPPPKKKRRIFERDFRLSSAWVSHWLLQSRKLAGEPTELVLAQIYADYFLPYYTPRSLIISYGNFPFSAHNSLLVYIKSKSSEQKQKTKAKAKKSKQKRTKLLLSLGSWQADQRSSFQLIIGRLSAPHCIDPELGQASGQAGSCVP